MKKRELGTSGLLVSELGLGCMSMPNDQHTANRIIATAIDSGITFFDTADLYDNGVNEEVIGKALKNYRQQIVLATKVGNRMNTDGNTWRWDASKEHIMEGVKASLHRLETDYIDLYQLHGGTIEDNFEEVCEAFERLKEQGVIRQYGISSIRPNVIKRFLNQSNAVSVMMQYNMLDRRPEEWFSLVSENHASVIARGPLAKGLLTSEGPIRAKSTQSFVSYTQSELIQTLDCLTNHSSQVHAAAIQYCLANQTVGTALVGARSEQQLLDSIFAYDRPIPTMKLNEMISCLTHQQYEDHRC